MGEQRILVERVGAVAVITLNRPEVFNALTLRDWEQLLDALIECGEDPGVRAVVLTGAGRAFCAGADLREMKAGACAGHAPTLLRKVTVFVHGAVATIARMAKPVIAAVNGTAAGAGFSLALAADLILAAEGAVFTPAYTKIGLSPDGSSTFFLPRLVGIKKAFELICSNRPLTASQARELGFVADIFPEQEFEPRVRGFAASLAAGPTQALGRAKRLLILSASGSLETQIGEAQEASGASQGLGSAPRGHPETGPSARRGPSALSQAAREFPPARAVAQPRHLRIHRLNTYRPEEGDIPSCAISPRKSCPTPG